MVTDPMGDAAHEWVREYVAVADVISPRPAARQFNAQDLHLAFCAGWQTLSGGLLTDVERDAIRLTGETADAVGAIIAAGGSDDTGPADWLEIAAAVHVIQRAVAANVAARAFPTLFRPLGGEIPA